MEQVRAFIAIELPDELKAGLGRLQSRLRTGNQPWVKWVDPHSIHLTLKFLGNIATDKIGEIIEVIEHSAQGISPFHLEVQELGVFPNLSRVQVAWVGIKGEIDKLRQLQQRIESNLGPLGFAPELRPFTPHLTLARLRPQASPNERQSFGQLISGTKFEPDYTVNVDSINLMSSQLTREGAIYRRISSVQLKKNLSTTTD
jgi:2'-5' RNA ligase